MSAHEVAKHMFFWTKSGAVVSMEPLNNMLPQVLEQVQVSQFNPLNEVHDIMIMRILN